MSSAYSASDENDTTTTTTKKGDDSATIVVKNTLLQCSICGTENKHSFSKRQRKRALMDPDAVIRCSNCIQQQKQQQEGNGSNNESGSGSDEVEVVDDDTKKTNIDSTLQKDEEEEEENDDDKKEEEESKKEKVLRNDTDNESDENEHNFDDDDDDAPTTSKPAVPSFTTIPRKKKRPKKPTLNDSDDDDDDSDQDASTPNVSLADLKRQIMGRDLIQDSVNGEEYHGPDRYDEEREEERILEASQAISKTANASLRQDLTCPICREICYPPVSAPCGHSFCEECMDWWKSSMEQNSSTIHILRCPTCRSHCGDQPLRVNIALKACVVALCGTDVVAKIRAKKESQKGEDGGAHDKGYEVLSPIEEELWRSMDERLRVRRNIVLDATDQRMQLALAVSEYEFGTNSLTIDVCLLQMEEDEAGDMGFPVHISGPEDEHLICSAEQRFQYTFLQVSMKAGSSTTSAGGTASNAGFVPIARLTWSTTRSLEFVLDDTIANHHEATAIKFVQEETGSELEIDLGLLKGSSMLGSSVRPQERRPPPSKERLVYDEMDADEDDEEGENLNEFENDGFLVDDGDDSDVEGQFSGEDDDEDDPCCICKDGGELMVCDGGDILDGCGKSFHASCVQRAKIPDGDWVCQECAKSSGIEASEKGHEFPVPDKKRRRDDDGDSSDDDFDTTKRKKPKSLDDSSDDDEVDNKKQKIIDEGVAMTKGRASIDDSSDEELEIENPKSLHDSSDEEGVPPRKPNSLDDGSDEEDKDETKKSADNSRRRVIDDSDSE